MQLCSYIIFEMKYVWLVEKMHVLMHMFPFIFTLQWTS